VRSSDSGRLVASVIALCGALGAFAVDALYLVAIAQQGATPPGGRVVFVALWIAASPASAAA